MNQPKVSVCISVYNKGEFFRKTLQSIVYQSYRNMEILIGDNASEEDIKSIVDEFKDERIQYFRNDVNIKGENFIRLVERANSEVVAVFHADDIYHEKMIEEEITALLNHPEVAGVFTLGEVIDEQDQKIRNHLERVDKMIKGRDAIFDLKSYLDAYLRGSSPFLTPTLMIRKEVYLKVGYNSNIFLIDDIDLWTRILEQHKLMVLNKRLFYYRNHSGQGGHIYISKQRDFIMPDIKYLYRYVTKNNIKVGLVGWFFLGGKFGKDCLRLLRNKVYRLLKLS